MSLRSPISLRLAVAFVVLIAGLLGLGAWGLDRLAAVDGEVKVMVTQRWPRIQTANRAIELMNENSRISLALFLLDDREEIERQIQQQDRNRDDITGLMAAIEASEDSTVGQALFHAVELARARYVDSFTRARGLLLEGRSDEGRRIAVREVLPRLNELRQTWDVFFAFESELMNHAAELSEGKYRSARRSVISVSLASAVFAALMALGITRNLEAVYRDLERARNEAESANRTLSEEMAARAKMEVELRQAQKLESVGRLAAGLAHEINTPVQFASDSASYIETAMEDLARLIERYRAVQRSVLEGMPSRTAALAAQKAEEAADLGRLLQNVPRAIESSLDGLDRIAAIVRSMQEFAPPQQGEMAAVDLNRAITNTLTVASNEYRGVADVETILGDIPLVPCRGGDLNQVILEVVINAAHAIADVVGDSGERGRIEVRTWREGDAVALSISDTGAGIPADIRGRIFDPFFTTKVVGRGTGQGLAIARAVVVERHGGALTFDTEVGKGSTFFIRLPLQPRRSGGTSPPFRPSAAS